MTECCDGLFVIIDTNFECFLPTFGNCRLLLNMEILKGLKLHLKPETWC